MMVSEKLLQIFQRYVIISLPRKSNSDVTQEKCAFLSFGKNACSLLAYLLVLCLNDLRGSNRSYAFFGAWLPAAHFFILEECLVSKAVKRSITFILCSAILLSAFGFSLMSNAAYENTWTNTGNQRLDIIEIAKTQIGYTEGSNNNNKYGDYFNGNYAPWCAWFVSWCAEQAGISDSIIHRQGQASPYSGYFNIPHHHGENYFPQPGDFVFYGPDSNGNHYHVGIVETVNPSTGYITTIEGNTNSDGSAEGYAVCRQNRHYQYSRICCYGSPNYGNTTPPTNVWISLPNGPESSYLQNEPVNITFGADNATSYRMEMYREYNGETSWYYGATFTSGICYASFDKLGHYSCYVFACNSGGETSSQWIGWDIVDSKPSALSITTDEKYYGINSTVKFKLNAQYGYYKHIGVHRILDTGNQLYYEQDVVGTNCSVTITEAGNYYADFDAFNACGRTRSDKVYFTVFENKPGKPIVTVTPGSSKTETVISWSTTTDTKYYDIYIIQDGKILQYVTDFQEKTYSILLPKGTYQVDVCACGYVYDWWTASGYQPFVIDDIPYLAPADSYTVIDSETHLIYGFQKRNSTPMNNLLDDGLISITGGDGYITHEYSNNKNVIGTDTRIRLFNADNELIDTYTVIIFGDVNGDGWYDGTDAYLVNLVANGMVEQSALTEAQRAAADCNHDGTVDNADVALLEQAGLLLANVDQTLPSEELQTNSIYLEYCSLIDQSITITEPHQPAADQPAQTAEQPAAPSVWGWIKALFTIVLNWLLRVF